MNRLGSSGGGGAAHDVELERFCLAGTDFLGSIVVAIGYKSAKRHTRQQQEMKGRTKNG